MSVDLPAENERLERASPEERLRFAVDRFGDGLLFTSSFGAGSGVLLHLWSRVAQHLPVIFLDTGFLFEETLLYKDDLAGRLGLTVETVRPEVSRSTFLTTHGTDISQRDPDLCCAHNKVLPLAPYVAKARGWVSGVRRDQSATRQHTPILERDANGVVKVYPLASLTNTDIQAYLHANGIPEHPLQKHRYLSIGCAPCTRPVGEGEGERAGRWAGTAKAECGLHRSAAERGAL